MFVNAVVGGSANIVQNDLVNIAWFGANTYAGNYTANANGYVDLENSMALGNPTNKLTLNGQSFVALDNASITNQSLTINSTNVGFGPYGSIYAAGSSNSWQANFILGSGSVCTFDVFSGSSLHLNGPISGPTGFTALAGVVSLDGSVSNSYTGLATVNAGATLVLNKSYPVTAIPGNLDVFGIVRLGGSQQTSYATDLKVESGGLFDFSTFEDYLNTLHGTGTVNFGAGGWTDIGLNGGSSEFDGTFAGIGYPSGWTVGKEGSGTFTLGGNSTYTSGITHVLAGTMVIDGSQPNIPVTVDSVATLAGSGTVGPDHRQWNHRSWQQWPWHFVLQQRDLFCHGQVDGSARWPDRRCRI